MSYYSINKTSIDNYKAISLIIFAKNITDALSHKLI